MVAAITLNPTHAKVGTSVLITGSAFNVGDTMSFTYGGVTIVPTEAPIIVAGDGTLPTCHIVIPASVEGIQAVVATDQSLNTATANFTVDPFISLSPSTQKIGGSITVTGTGFATLSAVIITIGGVTVTGVTTDATGGFSQAETVPTLASGAQTVSATDAVLNNATATLTVSAPTLARSPTHGPLGTVVTLTGSNYVPNATLTITNIDGTTTTTVTADSSGDIPASTTITTVAMPQGNHNISVDDGTNTATAVFTVDSALSILPTSGRIGSTATVTATGLAANSAITIEITATDITPAGSPTSDASGNYTGTVTIPTITSGAKTVTLTDASANAPTASFTVSAPTLVLSPTTGPVGTVVTCTGANYIPSATITFTNVDGSTTTATSDASGNIPASTTVTVETSPHGANNITCGDGTNTATASFSITQSITLDPTSGPANTEVLITGLGFLASTTITIKVDGTTVVTSPSTITSDDDGGFVGSTTLASLADGAHTILATDGTNSTTATFTVSQTLKFNSIQNDLKVRRVYQWAENVEIEADDTSYTDAVVMDTRNVANVLLTIYNQGGQTMDYATYGIIHESDNTVPPTDTAGIKKWIPIDVDQSLATTVSGSKNYTSFLWSYILLRIKLAGSTAATTAIFNAKAIDKNG